MTANWIRTPCRLGALAAMSLAVTAAAAIAIASSGAAAASAPDTIVLRELDRGGTFAAVDVAPHSKWVHGGPLHFSAGDEIVVTNPLEVEGKVIGKLRAVCTATGSGRTFSGSGMQCLGTYSLPGGTLVGSTLLGPKGRTGAITGGTGIYAGRSGSFAAKPASGGFETTIELGGGESGR